MDLEKLLKHSSVGYKSSESLDGYVFKTFLKVRDYEVDAEGIVNNANYLHYLEHTRHEFCNWAGLSFRDMHLSGLDPVLRKVTITYYKPLGLGQWMESKLRLTRRGPIFIFLQDIFTLDGEKVVGAEVEVVCLKNGTISRGQELAEAFKEYYE